MFFYFYIPFSIRNKQTKLIEKSVLEGENKGILCEHKLEITNDGLVETTGVGAQSATWDGIEKIVSTNDYTFIYVGSIMAHVLPKNKVIEGEYDAFIKLLIERYDASKNQVSE